MSGIEIGGEVSYKYKREGGLGIRIWDAGFRSSVVRATTIGVLWFNRHLDLGNVLACEDSGCCGESLWFC